MLNWAAVSKFLDESNIFLPELFRQATNKSANVAGAITCGSEFLHPVTAPEPPGMS